VDSTVPGNPQAAARLHRIEDWSAADAPIQTSSGGDDADDDERRRSA